MTEEVMVKDIIIQLLIGYVKTVIEENECSCGEPPFTDGNQCSVCFGGFIWDRIIANYSSGVELEALDEIINALIQSRRRVFPDAPPIGEGNA